MAIEKYLDLSTAHMTYSDSLILQRSAELPFRVLSDKYGFFVSAANAEYAELIGCDMSLDFIEVCKHARKNDCLYINFDRDAETIDGLHVNDVVIKHEPLQTTTTSIIRLHSRHRHGFSYSHGISNLKGNIMKKLLEKHILVLFPIAMVLCWFAAWLGVWIGRTFL